MPVPRRLPDRRSAWIGLLATILAAAVALAAVLGFLASIVMRWLWHK